MDRQNQKQVFKSQDHRPSTITKQKQITMRAEQMFKLSPPHAWYMDLSEEEKKRINKKYLEDEPPENIKSGRDLVEFIYKQENQILQ